MTPIAILGVFVACVAAVRIGCATARISVTRAGTAPAMPARADIDALFART